MTPYHLHAVAAAWSLQAARGRLAQLARDETRRNDAGLLAASTALRSPTYGTRHAVGGHGDPTGATLLTAEPAIATWRDLLGRLDGRLGWLAGQIGDDLGWTPLTRILAAIPALSPGTARLVAAHLADEDAWVRAAVRLAPAREPLPGVACRNPRCGQRLLEVLTAGPIEAWTVRCPVCLCIGQGCGCGMEGATEGALHIWPRTSVLGAVAGAAPSPTN